VNDVRHLAWIPAGAAVGFLSSFVLGDLLPLPVDLYYLLYFTVTVGFLWLYARLTDLDVSEWTSRRLASGVLLGLVGGGVLAMGVLARPATGGGPHAALWCDVLWRGVIYGTVDGLLLLAFPWVVVWRALGAERGGIWQKVGAGALAWGAVLVLTTAYHLGYEDFRSRKILQPNIGSTLGAVPTLLSANPVASPISHAVMHVAAVIHTPGTDLYLPPHRSPAHPPSGDAPAGPGQ